MWDQTILNMKFNHDAVQKESYIYDYLRSIQNLLLFQDRLTDYV